MSTCIRSDFAVGSRVRTEADLKVWSNLDGTVSGFVGLMVEGAIWVKLDNPPVPEKNVEGVPFDPEELILMEDTASLPPITETNSEDTNNE